ncbi:MAG: hypothetical protein EBZ93_07720, partial [Actinobacteria bacterium]|nr:hypothetical protein [Actinomycetota bacterium]
MSFNLEKYLVENNLTIISKIREDVGEDEAGPSKADLKQTDKDFRDLYKKKKEYADLQKKVKAVLAKHAIKAPDGSLKLKDVIRQIRKKRPLGQNKKLLLIVDQFEQWLYSRDLLKDSNLIQALRQIDGLAIQVILLVRDDFMFPVNRLMGLLELEIQENRNFTMMDLFPISHACKVLKLFGQALNCLPEGEISKKHEKFIQESIESISVEGKVVPARLAIFADM